MADHDSGRELGPGERVRTQEGGYDLVGVVLGQVRVRRMALSCLDPGSWGS